MTTGRINQISIGAGSKRQKRFEKGLLGLRFHLAVFLLGRLYVDRLGVFCVFWFLGLNQKAKKQR